MVRPWILRLLAASLLMTALGCDTEVPPATDAGTDGDSDTVADSGVDSHVPDWAPTPPADPAPPAEPELPALPRLESWVCAEGWLSVPHETVTDGDGVPFSWCEPPTPPRLMWDHYETPLDDGEAPDERPVCRPATEGSYAVLGDGACRPLGDRCPTSVWPEIPPEVSGARVYVLAGSSGGVGSEALPFGTITEAVDVALDGDVVVIGAGIYSEMVTVDRDISLWGRCVQDTLVDGPSGEPSDETAAIVVSEGAAAALRNLRISGEHPGIVAYGSIEVNGVWVHQATGVGVYCISCEASITGLLVDSTLDHAPQGGKGLAVYADPLRGEASAHISSATFENNSDYSIMVAGDEAIATLEDVIVRNSRPSDESVDESVGGGIVVYQGGALTVKRTLVDLTRYVGMRVQDDGSRVEAEDMVISRTSIAPSWSVEAYAVITFDGADVLLRRCLFDDNEAFGLVDFGDTGSDLRPSMWLEDTVVRNTHSVNDGYVVGHGSGLVSASSDLSAARCLFENNEYSSLHLRQGTISTIEDLWVKDTRVSNESGRGLFAWSEWESSDIVLSRAVIEGSHASGLSLHGTPHPEGEVTQISAVMEDITVRDTRETALALSSGIWIQGNYDATIRRANVYDSRRIGVATVGPGRSTLEDITVTDTTHESENDVAGITFYNRSHVTLTRARVEGSDQYGVSISAERNSAVDAVMTDVTVRDTRPRASDQWGGFGVYVTAAVAAMNRIDVEGSHMFGILLNGSNIDARIEDVRVAGTIPNTFDDWSSLPVDGSAFNDLGVGLVVRDGAVATVERALFEENAGFGAASVEKGSHLTLVDVRAVRSEPDRSLHQTGAGLAVLLNGSAEVRRGHFEGNRLTGIWVEDGESLALDEVLVKGTLATESDARFGRGLHVEGGGDVSITNSQFIGNRDASVTFFGEETTATLDHVYVGDTLERDCVDLDGNDPNHCTAGRGYGLGAYDGAVVTVDDVEIANSAGAGLQLADGGTVVGENLRVHGCPVAVNLWSLPDEYDWESAVSELLLAGNEVDVDESEMSIPELLPE